MQADTALINGDSITGAEYNAMFYLTPASNIEANLQTVGQIMLSVSNSSKLSDAQISSLQTLANKCPYTDGNGVYQARTLLEYHTGKVIIYNNANSCNHNNLHRPIERKENNIINNDSVKGVYFNIYPNPNNGNYTFTYNLGNEKEGLVEIYNQLGMKVGEYVLSLLSGSTNINNMNLSQGMYIYKLFTNTGIKKIGKIVIMK